MIEKGERHSVSLVSLHFLLTTVFFFYAVVRLETKKNLYWSSKTMAKVFLCMIVSPCIYRLTTHKKIAARRKGEPLDASLAFKSHFTKLLVSSSLTETLHHSNSQIESVVPSNSQY